jgi:tetratricopeptide (TPR) repeat protein
MNIRLLGLSALFFCCACGGAPSGGGKTADGDTALAKGTVADGEAMVERGDFVKAAMLFERIVVEEPDNPKAHYYLALSRRQLGDVKAAITHYEKAITLDDNLMDAHINLGLLLMDEGDLNRAEAELGRYLKASPEAADAQFNYGLVQETMGNLDKAESHYKKAVELDPEDPSALFGLGDVARKRGDKKGAVAFYEKARALDPEMPELVFVEGQTLLEMKETARACKLFTSLLDMSSPNLVVVNEAGKAIAGTDKACAAALYRGALEKDGKFAAAHFYLGNLLARDKEFEEAAKHFEQFIAIAPNDPAAPDARKRLEACKAQMK